MSTVIITTIIMHVMLFYIIKFTANYVCVADVIRNTICVIIGSFEKILIAFGLYIILPIM